MRKVFMWNIILRKPEPTKFKSNDYDIEGMEYNYWMSYLVDLNVEENDNIIVVTSLTKGNSAMDNYDAFQKEVLSIVEGRNAKAEFVTVYQEGNYDSKAFYSFFKEVAGLIKDDDRLYVDITFGIKPYTMSMLAALVYVTKAGSNVELETITYVEKYNGMQDPELVDEATVYNLTAMFYLINISGSLVEGDRKAADRMMEMLLR